MAVDGKPGDADRSTSADQRTFLALAQNVGARHLVFNARNALGAAMACFEEAVQYANTRVMFGKPISSFQLQQARLADMVTEIVKGQLLSLHLGRLKDRGTFTPQQVSMAKRNNVDIACNIAREARRLLGANGILAEYAAMRHMENLESVYTYEGTHDIHTLILGQAVTGVNAFQ